VQQKGDVWVALSLWAKMMAASKLVRTETLDNFVASTMNVHVLHFWQKHMLLVFSNFQDASIW